MQQFMRKFIQLNGVRAKIILDHCLFDGQVFYCDELQIINDDEKIGVILKGQAKFMYKRDVKVVDMLGDIYTISDGRLTIKVNKL
jgi:hypothetical protein